MDCVTEWRTFNITDTDLACIGTATNSMLKVLRVDHEFDCQNPTDEGSVPFLGALQNNHSLEHLFIAWSSTHPDHTVIEEDGAKCSKEFAETT